MLQSCDFLDWDSKQIKLFNQVSILGGFFSLLDKVDVIVVTRCSFLFGHGCLLNMDLVFEALCVFQKVFFIIAVLVGYFVLGALILEERLAVEVDVLLSFVQNLTLELRFCSLCLLV